MVQTPSFPAFSERERERERDREREREGRGREGGRQGERERERESKHARFHWRDRIMRQRAFGVQLVRERDEGSDETPLVCAVLMEASLRALHI